MKYKGFFVKITPDKNLLRENKNGEIVACEGFTVEVFADESERLEIDIFSAAVDFELLNNSIEEAEQFAKDYVDCEEKEYQRMIDEFSTK
ncbi:MAG: hypothetical protein NC489_16165 [Ruminococcus flavefaciens]|nr:hypothetical protein [Ruminococcus flavefaciens]